ncbi:DUF413 domain-containing protein [Marinobacter shengliensis]|uniref:DUF413 domain-containing protein n=1 Tax=Marinobacter shengliensis TaxID=1389223 RepID=UPI001E3E62DA|nr:DUF413 domain-containing protein [Marinobacter shengliensis]MCD1630800.1 DUF413 domain-containing protein [Marinobacter shengliensis]
MASAEHMKYRKMEFQPNVPDTLFSEDEIELLVTYGSWLAALMRGAISPETPAQERFVEVCNGNKNPESQFEKVWAKYIKRKIWESENPDFVGKQEADLLVNLGITGRGWGVYGHFR